MKQEKKSIFKKWWFWVLVVVLIAGVSGNEDEATKTGNVESTQVAKEEKNINKEEIKTESPVVENTQDSQEKQKESNVPKEYSNALKKAQVYSDFMHMSEKNIYDQLTSEYGEGFSVEAAKYAIDNVDADYNYNAYMKALTYQDSMSMSQNNIYEQLISEYGEQFTTEEATYAINKLKD